MEKVGGCSHGSLRKTRFKKIMKLKELLICDLKKARELQKLPEVNISIFYIFKKMLSPRFAPVFFYRLSHACSKHKIIILPKLFSLLNFVVFGIEISPQIEIGPGLFFPHTQGTVIGANKIGANALIFQQVTFGARELDMDFNPRLRPNVGNNVMIGSGAKILGGITIGDNSTIGANSVVITDVPAGATFAGIPAKQINKA